MRSCWVTPLMNKAAPSFFRIKFWEFAALVGVTIIGAITGTVQLTALYAISVNVTFYPVTP